VTFEAGDVVLGYGGAAVGVRQRGGSGIARISRACRSVRVERRASGIASPPGVDVAPGFPHVFVGAPGWPVPCGGGLQAGAVQTKPPSCSVRHGGSGRRPVRGYPSWGATLDQVMLVNEPRDLSIWFPTRPGFAVWVHVARVSAQPGSAIPQEETRCAYSKAPPTIKVAPAYQAAVLPR